MSNAWLTIPMFIDTLTKRREGVDPNYTAEHQCPKCKSVYLCPDRYHAQQCEPNDYIIKQNWVGLNFYTCTPCIMEASDDDRAAWYEAHGLRPTNQ